MKFFIIAFLCSISLSASAQWWRIGPFKHKRYPLLVQTKTYNFKKQSIQASEPMKVTSFRIPLYTELQKTELYTMRTAQRNMRYRIYGAASYNFSDLAKIYIQQNRLSEAKWYLLQSTLISKRQNNHRHTFENLLSLASIKMDMGDVSLARQDLVEARNIANTLGWIKDAKDIDEKIKAIQGVDSTAPKYELKYADASQLPAKSK